ncbi:MAG: o-succinylbenzoate synthase [Bacteroidetes bacterium]|nr:o-succinylbenzoate synthase [Bacteroidota bacterium]
MVLRFEIEAHTLKYKKPATTSRGVLNERKLWILKAFDVNTPAVIGCGECGIIPALSPEDIDGFDKEISRLVEKLNHNQKIEQEELQKYPAFRFAYETALLDLKNGGKKMIFENPYSLGLEGIKINGLVWMAEIEEMLNEAKAKLQAGFDCIKFKIGTFDFDKECRLIEQIRKTANSSLLQIRLDANGAFPVSDALKMLKELKRFEIHSIEQPIAKGQWEEMEELCAKSPVSIALDEELIGIDIEKEGEKMLKKIRPQWIILKPSLVGGLRVSEQWITLAEKYQIGWWATSALESNIGLNAIAQWVASKNTRIHQGLGTGHLYTNNFNPETKIIDGNLWKVIRE